MNREPRFAESGSSLPSPEQKAADNVIESTGFKRGPIVLGLALALLTGEFLCRNIYFQKQTFHPRFGYVFKPGTKAVQSREGYGMSSWTQHGFRRAKPMPAAGETSILVLGDSYTEALQVNDKEVYTDLLEERLERAGHRIPIVNAGRSGYSVADYIDEAPDYKKLIQPHWVVLQVRDSDFTEEAWSARRGFATFQVRETNMISVLGSVRPPPGLKRQAVQALQNSSALLRFSILRIYEFKKWFAEEPPIFVGVRKAAEIPAYRNAESFPVEAELAMLAEAFNFRCTILYLPLFSMDGVSEPSPLGRRLKDHAGKSGIPFLAIDWSRSNLKEAGLAPSGFNNSRFNFGHLNALGHKIVAEQLFDHLAQVLIKDGLHQP